jgi:hypothetical protein
MKLSDNTIAILKNFATINPSILVRPGSTLSTISQHKSIFAKAIVTETFPREFAIYELTKFLGVLSLFNDPEIEFEEKSMLIKSGNQQLSYTYAEPTMIVAPPEKEIGFPEPEIDFNITQEELQKVVRATGVLQVPDISVQGDEEVIRVYALNPKNSTGDTFSIDVGKTDKHFDMFFKADNITKLIPANYNVKISSQGLALYTSDKISYYVATESNSKYQG